MQVMITDEDAPIMESASQKSHITISSESSDEMRSLVQHHEATPVAAVGSKRHRIILHQDDVDDMVSLSKYPKLATAEQILEPQEGQSASSSSDGFFEESSDTENKSQEENGHPTKASPGHSSNGGVQLHSGDPAAAELDSDEDSVAISPQREVLNNNIISTIEERESSETITKLMSVSTALRIQNHITHTSQLTPNNDLENNNINSVVNLEATIKQSNSQGFSCDGSTDEPVNVISIPESSSFTESQDAYLHPDVIEKQADLQNVAPSGLGAFTEKEADLQNLARSGLYAVPTQSLRQSNLKIENSNSQSQHSQQSQDNYQEQIDEQPIRNKVYPQLHQIQVIDNQVPSTSRDFEESSYGLSRASSVSELNLAHLVLSLKSDIQKLTEKVGKQEVILDAVIHSNQVNLSPLFTRSFQETYNLKVPFTKLEDFLKFNEDLENNQKFCNEFITSLTGYIDKEVTLSKNVLNMVKQYMSKDLALLYNASKPTPNKMVLKDTIFCKCLLQATKIAIKNDKLPLEREKSFMKTLGHVISGARGWHNHNEE